MEWDRPEGQIFIYVLHLPYDNFDFMIAFSITLWKTNKKYHRIYYMHCYIVYSALLLDIMWKYI